MNLQVTQPPTVKLIPTRRGTLSIIIVWKDKIRKYYTAEEALPIPWIALDSHIQTQTHILCLKLYCVRLKKPEITDVLLEVPCERTISILTKHKHHQSICAIYSKLSKCIQVKQLCVASKKIHYSCGEPIPGSWERSPRKRNMIGEWLFAVSHRCDMKIHMEEELPLTDCLMRTNR